MHTSSNRGDIQKWRPGVSSQLKDESLLSSVSQPLDGAMAKSKKANGHQNRSVIANRGPHEPNLTGAISHPENTTVNVEDSLISAGPLVDKSVEK